jgi:hypothetical protein
MSTLQGYGFGNKRRNVGSNDNENIGSVRFDGTLQTTPL